MAAALATKWEHSQKEIATAWASVHPTRPQNCAHTMHPAITQILLRHHPTLTTELFAQPPFLSPFLADHRITQPFLSHTLIHDPLAMPHQGAMGIIDAANQHLPPIITAAPHSEAVFLILLGPIPPQVRALISAELGEDLHKLKPHSLPTPPLDLLTGGASTTRSANAQYKGQAHFLTLNMNPNFTALCNDIHKHFHLSHHEERAHDTKLFEPEAPEQTTNPSHQPLTAHQAQSLGYQLAWFGHSTSLNTSAPQQSY